MKYDDFINLLRSYRWLGREIKELNWKIEEEANNVYGLPSRGIQLSDEQMKSTKPMPHYTGRAKAPVDKIERLDELRQTQKGLKRLRRSADEVLLRMPENDRRIVVGFYCDGDSTEKLARQYGFANRAAVYKRMKSVIKQSL